MAVDLKLPICLVLAVDLLAVPGHASTLDSAVSFVTAMIPKTWKEVSRGKSWAYAAPLDKPTFFWLFYSSNSSESRDLEKLQLSHFGEQFKFKDHSNRVLYYSSTTCFYDVTPIGDYLTPLDFWVHVIKYLRHLVYL